MNPLNIPRMLSADGGANADGGGRAEGHSKETILRGNPSPRDLEPTLPEPYSEQPAPINDEEL